MSERIEVNIAGVWKSRDYPMSQAVVEPQGRRVHLSGQVAWDEDFNVQFVGDAGAQTQLALRHIEKVLLTLGGGLADVVSLTTFYVREQDKEAITDARRSVLNAANARPATTGIQAAKIWSDDLLVELVAIAVIPHERFKAN